MNQVSWTPIQNGLPKPRKPVLVTQYDPLDSVLYVSAGFYSETYDCFVEQDAVLTVDDVETVVLHNVTAWADMPEPLHPPRWRNRSHEIMITHKQLTKINVKRCESPEGFNHSLNSWTYQDWLTAVVGEFGEACNVVKKLNRVRDNIPGNKETKLDLVKALGFEIADTAIYLNLLEAHEGIEPRDFPLSSFKPGQNARFDLNYALRKLLDKQYGSVYRELSLLAHQYNIDFYGAIREKFNLTSWRMGCEIRF